MLFSLSVLLQVESSLGGCILGVQPPQDCKGRQGASECVLEGGGGGVVAAKTDK